jgi:hypothetical protein
LALVDILENKPTDLLIDEQHEVDWLSPNPVVPIALVDYSNLPDLIGGSFDGTIAPSLLLRF